MSRTPGFCGVPCTPWSFSPLLAPWGFCLWPSSAFHLEKSLTQTAGLTSHASSELVIKLLCSCPSTRSRASTTFFYLFWEGPDSKYFRLFGLSSLCHTYSTVPLSHVSSPREYINERVWLFSNKTSFMDTEVGISDNFHVSQNSLLLICFNDLKMEKSSLASRACKTQAAEQIRLVDYSSPCSLSSAVWQMTTNWAAESSTHWLLHSFCGSGVQAQPGRVLRVLKGCSQGVSQAVLSFGGLAWQEPTSELI